MSAADRSPYCRCGQPFRFRVDLFNQDGAWVHSTHYWCARCDVAEEKAVNERERRNDGRET